VFPGSAWNRLFSVALYSLMVASAGMLISGRYRLINVLGAGAMGRVWLGEDELIGREVAIKEVLLPPEISEDQRRELNQRAIREARAAGRLNHPCIVTVHDVIEHDGAPAIVMEYVRGRSLAEVIKAEGALPPDRVAAIAAAMLAALRVAHEAGIVHRDLKPANVLLDGDRAVITDFGVARLAGDAELTRSGMLIGTPAYMAPEQAEREQATPASDLWSLGATLYAAVEGRPPFEGETVMGVLAAVLNKAPRAPRRAAHLSPLLYALLVKDPARRPTADQARQLLAAASGGGTHPQAGRVPGQPAPATPAAGPTPPPMAGPPSSWPATSTVRARPRRRGPLWVGVFSLVALIVAPFAWKWGWDNGPGTPNLRPPSAHGKGGNSEGKRSESGGAGRPVEITNAVRLTGHRQGVTAMAFSPNGRSLASVDGEPTREGPKTRLWDVTRGRLSATLVGPAPRGSGSVNAVAFSPDGTLVAAGGNYGLDVSTRLWRVAGRRLVGPLAQSDSIMKSLAFSPDGKTLAGVANTGKVMLWDVASRRVKIGLPDGSGFGNVVFSPDGKLLANPGKGRDIRLSEVATGRTVHTITDATSSDVAFSPDGKTLAVPDSDGTRSLRLWDVATGRSTAAFSRTEELVVSVVFSPDGKTIASVGHGNIVQLWDVTARRVRAVLVGHSGRVNTVAFSPNGRKIATGSRDNTIRIWNLRR
jgi:sugar lactone lactonase YvrE/predicted Ser/Thr protein kinase